jgi:prevent-host-death family protein
MQHFRSQDMQRQGAVIQEAAMREPVVITYHDRPRLVLMSIQEYDRLRGRRRKAGAAAELPAAVANDIVGLGRTAEEAEPETTLPHGPHS